VILPTIRVPGLNAFPSERSTIGNTFLRAKIVVPDIYATYSRQTVTDQPDRGDRVRFTSHRRNIMEWPTPKGPRKKNEIFWKPVPRIVRDECRMPPTLHLPVTIEPKNDDPGERLLTFSYNNTYSRFTRWYTETFARNYRTVYARGRKDKRQNARRNVRMIIVRFDDKRYFSSLSSLSLPIWRKQVRVER